MENPENIENIENVNNVDNIDKIENKQKDDIKIENNFSLLDITNTKEKKLKSIFMDSFLSDTILKNSVSGKEFNCHKVVLCSGSKFFYFNFLNYEKEIEIKENKYLFEIPDKINTTISYIDDDNTISIMLKFLYNNQKIKKIKKELKYENIFNLISLAHSFNIPKLNKHLGKIIKEEHLKEENCVRIYKESLQYENEKLQIECLNMIKNNFEKIIENLDEFQMILELPLEVFYDIIKSDDLVVKVEKTICDVVMNYIKIRRNLENIKNIDINRRYDDKEIEVVPIENIIPNQNKTPKNYNEYWKSHIEELKLKLTKKSLTKEEERKLIEQIRFSYLTHSELLSLSTENMMNDHKDLILEGLSIRLHSYENCKDKTILKINTNSRKYIQPIIEKKEEMISENKSINYEDLVNFKRTSVIKNTSQNINYNSLTQSKIRPPQDIKISSIPYYKSNNPYSIDFNYEFDFDENGIFYYLGTLGKSTIYRNPSEIGQVKVFSSSIGKGSLSEFLSRDLVNLRTLNEPFSFFGIDLGEDRFLVPNCYSIRNRNSSSHVMLNWTLEGSNDKVNFETIDTRIFTHNDNRVNLSLERERNLLKSPGCSSTWGIDTNIKEKFPNGFRYFLLKQVDKNSSGSYNLAISGFELYGKGIGRWNF